MSKQQFKSYSMPVKPYSFIDAVNRRAAATGSVGYAIAASNADYNGHYNHLTWNDYRGYYVGEYYWGERCVITRDTNFKAALEAMKREYKRQGKGAYLIVSPKTAEDAAVCAADPELRVYDKEKEQAELESWMDWRFSYIDMALRQNTVHLLADSTSYEDYREKIRGSSKRVVAPESEPQL